MGKLHPPPGGQGPTLDVQVLEGLETYIATDQFLHKLEQASAEWIDLSLPPHARNAGWLKDAGLELTQGASAEQPDSSASATDAVRPAATSKPGTIAPACAPPAASRRYATWLFSRPKAQPVRIADMVASNVSGTNNSSRGSLSSSSPGVCSATGGQQEDAAPQGQVAHSSSLAACIDMSPANMPAASSFEVIEQQPPLHQDLALQEPFVMVSSEDAIEGMAYYIALYLSRAPEARYMEPMQLQAALRHTFTAIRRSRYRVIWDWGRWLYRWGGVSYSALQLYEHPWVVRALVAAIWTSSKMTLGLLW